MALTRDFIVKNGLVVLAAGSAQSISTTTGAIVTPGGVGIGGNVNIGSTINSTNATNGALTVAGGASVQQDLWVGGDIYSRGNPVITSQTLGAYGVSRITAGVGIQVSSNTGSVTVTNIGVVSLAGSTYLGISAASGSNITLTNLGVQTLTAGTDTAVSSTTGTITVWNTSTLQSITARGASTINAININNQAASNSTNSGALQVLGGVGVGGSIYAGNLFANGAQVWTTATLTNLGQLSNTTTQYLTSSTLGQYGVSSIQPGTGITVSTSSGIVTITNVGVVSLVGSQYLGISAASGTSITLTNLGVQSLTAGADISVSASTGTITVSGTGTFQTVTNRGSTTTNAIRVNNTTSVNSTATGALQVVGGVGIGGGLFVGGTITATSLTIGGYPISTSSVMTASYFGSPLGTFTNLNFATGTTATIVGGSVTLQSIGASVTVSDTPPSGPAPGNLWWDSTVGILRVYYADGTSNQWVDAFPIVQGPAGPQGAPGVFTGTISTQLGLTNNTASTSTNTGALTVGGGVGIAGDLYVGGEIVANKLTIQLTTITTTLVQTDDIIQTLNITPSSSTSTGALIVAGGAGIGGDLNAGGDIVSDGGSIYSYISGVTGGGIFADGIIDGGSLRVETTATVVGGVVATSTNSGALQVVGGVGIGGALYVGNTSYIAGSQIVTTATIGSFAVTSSAYATTSSLAAYATTSSRAAYATTASIAAYATTASSAAYATTSSIATSAAYATTSSIASTATSAAVAYSLASTSTTQVGFAVNAFTATNAFFASTSTNAFFASTATNAGFAYSFNTGTLVTTAVNHQGGSVNATTGVFSGITSVTNTTTAVSTSTGALQVAGGAGIGGAIYAGSTSYVNGAQIITTATIGSFAVTSSGYATTSSLAAYATTASLAAYATTASLASYATTSSIATSAAYATTSSLASYATTSSIATSAAYATTSSLASYATTSSIATSAAYATTSSIASTATSAAVAYSLASTSTTQVGFAVNAFTATNAAFAWSFNTNTVVTNAVNATNATNSLYANTATNWLGGTVYNPVTFGGTVTFSGTATFINSTSTLYTDNILEIHVPVGGMDALWGIDDGKDIGFHFHYFKNSTDTNAALLLRNDSKYLEWFSAGNDSISNGNNFTGTTYGTFKTGSIILADTSATISSSTGALTVAGGVGIGGSAYVAGNLTVLGTINATVSGTITTATNIAGGGAGAIHMQNGLGATSFIAAGTSGQLLQSAGTTATFVSTSTLQVGFAVNAFTATYANIVTNIAGASAGYIPIQSGTGATSFIAPGTAGDILRMQIGSTATFVSTTTLQVGNALLATTATSAAVAYSLASTSTTQVGFAVNAFTATNAFFASTATNAFFASSATFAASFNTGTLVTTAVNQQGGSVNATTGVFSGVTTVTNITASTTTATGALQVAGGLGVGKSINSGPGATNRNIVNASAVGNMFTAAGDSQYVNYILGIKTTTNAATGLSTDHAVAGAANQIILPNASAYGFKAYVTARDTVNQWMGVWQITGGIRRGATAASTTLVGTPVITRIAYDTTATTWAATTVADTTNGGLQVRVTGTGTQNITWVANVLTIEVA